MHGLAVFKQYNPQIPVPRRLDPLPFSDPTIALNMYRIGIHDRCLDPEILNRLAVRSASCCQEVPRYFHEGTLVHAAKKVQSGLFFNDEEAEGERLKGTGLKGTESVWLARTALSEVADKVPSQDVLNEIQEPMPTQEEIAVLKSSIYVFVAASLESARTTTRTRG